MKGWIDGEGPVWIAGITVALGVIVILGNLVRYVLG